MGFTAKMTLLFNLLGALILVVYGVMSVKTQLAEKISDIDAELAIAAQSYIKVVGEDKIDRAFRSGATARSVPEEEYKADVASMGEYASDLGLAYLYSMTVVDGKAKYVLDGAPQSEID
ncbi:MAG: hypothetical protein LBC63_07835, partial [Holophagales bacterium]|nr:hypothetical protein [Holophagales bacterium]